MESRSVAKLSTKKALSSLRTFLCCNGNDEDKINFDVRNGFLTNSPLKDKTLDDFDVNAFVNKFLTGQICCHGNPGSVCVSCYFSNHGNIEDYIITRPNNTEAGTPDSCVKEPIFVYDNQSFCECCEPNNDNCNDHDYENIPNTFSDKELQVAFDTDNVSLCSSCYHSNCTMCREEEEEAYVTNGDKTEFSVECSTPNFDAEGLRKLLRQLNPNIPVTCIHGNYGNASELFCCQAEEVVSTDTVSTEKSKNDKDSGVGRTDDSMKNDESSEQEMPECTSPGHDVDPERHCSNDSFTSNSTAECLMTEDQLIKECDRFRQALEQRCGINFQDDVFKVAKQTDPGQPNLERVDSQSSIEREIRALNEEMKKIQLECQEIVDAHKHEPVKSVSKQDTRSSPNRVVPRMGTRLDYAKQLQLQQELQDPVWVPREQFKYSQRSPVLPQTTTQKPNIILPLGDKKAFPNKNQSCTQQSACRTQPVDRTQDVSSKTCSKGENCHSAPLTLELKQSDRPSLSLKTAPSIGAVQNSANEPADGKCSVSKSISNSSVNQITQTPEPSAENLQELYSQYADVMYTNQANLQHTIMLQQKLFQQKMSQQQCASTNGTIHSGTETLKSGDCSAKEGQTQELKLYDQTHLTKNETPCSTGSVPLSPYSSLAKMRQGDSSGTNTSNVQMEWVVKRRADGSRYITRRPMRSKMLKERARKISEERCGMTTDDDAMSELKVGRYWSKDERKRHLEKAREYKRRKQEMLRQRMETVKENDDQKKEPNILELSQRKMMKHKGRKMFDDFTTVQEMLVHGSRSSTGSAELPQPTGSAPLLSVTTV